jgi:hypothetical protein
MKKICLLAIASFFSVLAFSQGAVKAKNLPGQTTVATSNTTTTTQATQTTHAAKIAKIRTAQHSVVNDRQAGSAVPAVAAVPTGVRPASTKPVVVDPKFTAKPADVKQ